MIVLIQHVHVHKWDLLFSTTVYYVCNPCFSSFFIKLSTLRGTVLEETIPTSAKSSSSRGIPPKEVIEYVTQGELQTSSLKLAKYEEKVMLYFNFHPTIVQ